jgi:ABC-type glycerol-3-phosphate transport system substrate-binding protein
MELKGFTRQQRRITIATAAGIAIAAVGGLTAPVAVAQETQTWTMPGLKEEILQRAVDAVTAAAGENNVKFNVYDRQFNQVVYNYTNWIVCGQSPKADSAVKVNPKKPQTVTFALSRPAAGC